MWPHRRNIIKRTEAIKAICIWFATSLMVFAVVDAVATRNVPIQVEDHRGPSMTDEQTLSLALQAAYDIEGNNWWIHDKRPYLVFDESRSYRIAPQLYDAFNLEITRDAYQRKIALLRPQVASMLAP